MKFAHLCIAAATTSMLVNPSEAAEGFLVRYNIAGSLGGEMFAPPDQSGPWVAAAATYIDGKKITGADGGRLRTMVPGGRVQLGAAPGALDPSYGGSTVEVDAKGRAEMYNLVVGYISQERFAGGRMISLLNLPYGKKTQTFTSTGTTPALNWPASSAVLSAAQKSATEAGFDRAYQSRIKAAADDQSGTESGIGDAELQTAWLYTTPTWRVLAGASLVVPTGKYNASAGPDMGAGNFYTFRPAVQVAWLPTPEIALAGKLTVGLNTRNRDNDLRSGNWVGLEAAAGYKTPIGPIGVHAIHVQQVQDDSKNPFGAARFRSTNLGLFLTTKLPVVDAVLTVQTMKTVDSRWARHGSFHQIRMIKLF